MAAKKNAISWLERNCIESDAVIEYLYQQLRKRLLQRATKHPAWALGLCSAMSEDLKNQEVWIFKNKMQKK